MSVEGPLVSIVMPVRNGERFLGRTLASALAQIYSPIEVIVVDDGSTDRTAALVKETADRDNRVRLFCTQQSGVAAARNFGVSHARGKLIAPLDADDLWHPEKVSRQVAVLKASPAKVGVVYCWCIHIDEDDFVMTPVRANSTAQGRVTSSLAEINILQTSSTALIKRASFDAVGGYDVNLKQAEDWKLYLALSDVCDFAVVPEHLVGYRQSAGSLSRNVSSMAHSSELVMSWMEAKWPGLAEQARRPRTYNLYAYMAQTAFNNKQLLNALKYQVVAWRARPEMIFERSNMFFMSRLLARMVGLSPIVRSVMRERTSHSIRFQEFPWERYAGSRTS